MSVVGIKNKPMDEDEMKEADELGVTFQFLN